MSTAVSTVTTAASARTPSPAGAGDLGTTARQDRRHRILEATVELASGGGFEAVQMRSVADRAEVALGTLYRYFPSKVHLLVSALAGELERADAALQEHRVRGTTPAERVGRVLERTTRRMQDDPHLTEALTRAFVFADASVRAETQAVEVLLTRMLTRAMHPDRSEPSEEDVAVARVIGDVWLATLVGWVTGRTSAEDTAQHLRTAVALLLRD